MDTEAVTDDHLSDHAVPSDDDRIYTVLSGGESIFDISMKVGVKVPELMEHNGLTSYRVQQDVVLHLPYAKPPVKEDILVTQLWDEPKTYYITRPEGSRKYSFGGAKTWTDITPYGATHPKYRELRIAGLATLTFSEDRIYQYYIHDIDVKDGKAKPCGFPKEFLTEGTAPSVPESRHPSVAQIEAEIAAVAPVLPVEAEIDPEDDSEDDTELNPNLWKTTYKPLPDGEEGYVILRDVIVQELDGRRWQRTLKQGSEYTIGGTVMKDGHEWGIPIKPKRQEDLYYGIPWNSTTVMRAVDYDKINTAAIDTKDGEKYEVTAVQANRLKIYEDALFRPLMKTVAQAHVKTLKTIDSFKKGKK